MNSETASSSISARTFWTTCGSRVILLGTFRSVVINCCSSISLYAFCAVFGLIPSCAAISRRDGISCPLCNSSVAIRCLNQRTTCRYTGLLWSNCIGRPPFPVQCIKTLIHFSSVSYSSYSLSVKTVFFFRHEKPRKSHHPILGW